jgi:ATP-dependent DNA helicase RecQ
LSKSANEILKEYWGFDEFRPMQSEIIQSVLDGQDTLALLPTGGGKSICFQVPALMKEGICIDCFNERSSLQFKETRH